MRVGLVAMVAFLGIGVLGAALLYGRVLSHLRDVHAGTWEALGRPRVTPGSLFGERVPMQRFLWSREFDALDDPELARKCEAFRWFLTVFVFATPVVALVASARPPA